MKPIRTSPSRKRSVFASALVGAMVLGTVMAGPAMADDPDHPDPVDPEPPVVTPVDPDGEGALNWNNYEKITLSKTVGEPIGLTVMPDLRVLHTARTGAVRLTDPAAGTTEIVNTLDVYSNSEDGLQGLSISPNFEEDNWVYLVYAPRDDTPLGNAPQSLPAGADDSYWDMWLGINRLARFQWTGSELDMASEQTILEWEVQRGQCCHVGADIDFDGDGNLYLTTGDNTPASTPGAAGFTVTNDAPGMNPGFDARRSSGNTNDLRGKILRISPLDEIAEGAEPGVGSTYEIPEGNLFEPGTELTRPEIFVMGVRNPFRMSVDPINNVLVWADYGPDATSTAADNADPYRGPMGLVEWDFTPLDTPINAGWPFVTGDNFAYADWDFATATPKGMFDPENLKNESRWNTGLVDLPSAPPAKIWYGDDPGDADQPFDEFVNFGQGRGQGPMGGPIYHYDAENPSPTKFPEHWDNKAFFGEFSQHYYAAITADWAGNGAVTAVEDFLPNGSVTSHDVPFHDGPIDFEFGPDGSLYVLEYGRGFFRENPGAGLHRIDYAEGNKSPVARFTATPISGSEAPLTVQFDASLSSDPEGEALTYEWDLDGNGTFETTGATAEYTYTELGQYTVRLRVTDPSGKFGITSRVVSVGNTAPEVIVDYPAEGSFFEWGQHIPFSISTQDAEDGTDTVCSRVAWTYGLGHDEHAHPEASGTGCTGVWRTDPNSPEHGIGAYLYGAVVVSYTDNGANGQPPARGETSLHLNPFTQEAENAQVRQGVVIYNDETASGNRAIRGLGTGDFLKYTPVNFTGVDGVTVRANGGGQVQLRWNAADAEPFATGTVPGSAGWHDVVVPFTSVPEGTGELFVTSADEIALDVLTFTGAGVGDTTAPTVSHTLNPAEPTGVGGVYNVPVTVTLDVQDNGVIQTVQQSRDGGATWQNINAQQGAYRFILDQNGSYEILYRATDSAGNVSEVGTLSVTVDRAAPNVPVIESTTTAAVATSTVTYGAPGSVEVTVTAEGGVPTGEITLSAGDTVVGVGTLEDGVATVELARTLPVGAHVLTATYGADTTFMSSTGTVRLNVAKAGSQVEASVSPNPVKPAVAAKVAVHAESSTGVAGAGKITVLVKRGVSTVATLTGTLDAEGDVVVTLPRLSAATYSITVTHAATSNTHASSTTTSLVVRN